MAGRLTDAKIKGLRVPAEGQVEYSDSDVPGLRVRIGKSGVKTFILRKRVGGKQRNLTLGRYDERRFGLAAARHKARVLLSDVEAGKAIVQPARQALAAPTIASLMPAYLASKAHLRSYREIERVADRYILPVLGDRLADAVTRGEVTAFVDTIAERAPTMARAAHAQLSAFYSWAMQRQLEALPANPCASAGRPDRPKPRNRVLSDDELRALWQVAEGEALPWGAGIKLLILTGARREEVFEAEWREFDLAGREWLLPEERAKNGGALLLPLPPAAIEVLRAIPKVEGSGMVFPTRTKAGPAERGPSGYSKAVRRIRAAVDARLGRADQSGEAWTLHDIRRTLATGMQRLGVRFEVTEAILNHSSGSRGGIAGVYQRHDWKAEKRHALDAWAQHVAGVLSQGSGR